MTRLVALHNKEHRKLKVNTQKIESVGANENMVPVVLSEFLKLSVQYPIVFTKNEESGKFICVSLLGFEPGENLFWKNDSWDGIYIPLNISRQPFFIGRDENKNYVICIDIASDCVSLEQGADIFDEQGKDTDHLTKSKAMIAELLEGEIETEKFIAKLLENELIMPLSLDITFADENTHRVKGLYTLDEKKLELLSSDVIAQFHKEKYLKPIYIMIASLSHIYSLVQRKNIRLIS